MRFTVSYREDEGAYGGAVIVVSSSANAEDSQCELSDISVEDGEVQLQSAAPEDARSHGFAFFADVRRILSLSTE